MPKRPPGVYKRGATWSVVIEHGRDPNTGKRKQVWHSGFATLSEAAEARTRLLRERDTGVAIDPSRQTFAEFIRNEWLPSRSPTTGRAGRRHRGKVGIQTWDSYRGDLERHVIPRIGGIALQKLTPSDLNRLYDELEQSGGQRGAGLAPKTIANIHGVTTRRSSTRSSSARCRATSPTRSRSRRRRRRSTTSGRPNSCGRSCNR